MRHGVFIQGDPRSDPLVQARYADAIVAVANSGDQTELRQVMMQEARARFDW